MKKLTSLTALGLMLSSALMAQNFSVSGGTHYSLALCAGGNIISWGSNGAGQLARKTSTFATVTGSDGAITVAADWKPTIVNLKDAANNSITFTAVDAGSGAHAIAIACDSTVWTWGVNEHGQLGNGSISSSSYSTPSQNKCTDITSVDFVGTQASICNKAVPQHVVAGETAIAGNEYKEYLKNVISISASTSGSFAIVKNKKTGKTNLLAWGSNKDYKAYCNAQGQLGVGLSTAQVDASTYPRYVKFKNEAGELMALENVIAVDAGDNNCFALVDDDNDGDPTTGTVYGWGQNSANNIMPTNTNAVLWATPITIDAAGTKPLTGVKSICAGDGFLIAYDKNGFVWSVGSEWCASGAIESTRANGRAAWTNPKEAAKVIPGEVFLYNGGDSYMGKVHGLSAGQSSAMAMVELTIGGKTSNYIAAWGASYGSEDRPVGKDCVNDLALNDALGTLNPRLAYRTNWRTGTVEMIDSVLSISSGDGMMFAFRLEKNANGDEVRQLYVTGSNGAGQLGLDNATIKGVCTFTKLDLSSEHISAELNDTLRKFWTTQKMVGPTVGALNLIGDTTKAVMNNWWFPSGIYTASTIFEDASPALKVDFANAISSIGTSYNDFVIQWYKFQYDYNIPKNPFGYSVSSIKGSINYSASNEIDTMYSAFVDLEKNPVVKLIAKSDKKVNIRVDLIDANGRTANITQAHHWLQGGNVLDTLEFRWDNKYLNGNLNYGFEDTLSYEYDVALAADGYSGYFFGQPIRNGANQFLFNRSGWSGAALLDLKKIVGLRVFFDDGRIAEKFSLEMNKTVTIKQITVGDNGIPVNVADYTLEKLLPQDTTPKIAFTAQNIVVNQYTKQDIRQLVKVSNVPQLKFSVINSEIASIDNNGILTAQQIGETQVVVYDNSNAKIADTLTITIVKARNISFVLPRFVIFENETIDLSTCVKTTQGTEFGLSIANSAIANFGAESGKLTGIKYGTTMAYATNRAITEEKDSAVILVLPNIIIVGVQIDGSGTFVEVYVNGNHQLYDGIEKDFLVSVQQKLKSDATFTVTRVMKSADNPNVLLLQLDKPLSKDQQITISYAPQAAATPEKSAHSSFTMNATANSESAEDKVSVYPNPAQTAITAQAAELQSVILYNAQGAMVAQANALAQAASISVEHLPAGMYVAELITTSKTIKKTIIKQ